MIRFLNKPKARVALIVAGLAAAILVAIAVTLINERSVKSISRTPETLTIADASQPSFALVYVADARGYFREEGLDISFNKFTLGRDALTSVIEGKSDIATVYETPVVLRTYEGKKLGILSTLHTSTQSHALLGRRDRGITGPGDLKGKRIGVTPGTSMEYFLSVFLATEGIAAREVIAVKVEPAQYQAALSNGSVDALVVFNPHLSQLRETFGEERLVVFHSDVFVEASMLVGRRDAMPEKKEAIERFLRAIVRAQDFAGRDREESIRIVVARLAGTYTESAIRSSLNTFRLEAKLHNVLLTILTQEAQWFRDAGRFDSAVPNFAQAIVTEYLRSVKPEAVTLVSRPGIR